MDAYRFSHKRISRYSELVCTAVRLGVSLDAIMAETRRYHGNDFSSAVEQSVKDMLSIS